MPLQITSFRNCLLLLTIGIVLYSIDLSLHSHEFLLTLLFLLLVANEQIRWEKQ
jgi:hypothetical protein